MKNKFNALRQYIFEKSNKEYHKETVNGLFRAILEPVISNQKFEACVLFKLNDLDEKLSIIKRLSFSSASVYSFSGSLNELEYENIQKDDLWGTTEFVVVIGARYSAVMMWDYSLSTNKSFTPVCLVYNSALISDIAKEISKNTNKDIKDILFKYLPDRRENTILNKSINLIADNLNSKIEEIIFSELEKSKLLNEDDRLQTAEIIAEKAKFIAHEIKNNLSIINLYSKICEKRLDSVETSEEVLQAFKLALNNIQNASESISSHISDLRSLSAPYKTEISTKELILTTAMQCEEKALQAGVNISIADFKDCMVFTDRIKLQSVILNLIYNAIEACTNGNSIVIDSFVEKKFVKIFVKNNGAKIPKELQEKIFEPNFTTKEKGNGLGLAICKKQLELLGSSLILVHSNSVETLFEIAIPLK